MNQQVHVCNRCRVELDHVSERCPVCGRSLEELTRVGDVYDPEPLRAVMQQHARRLAKGSVAE
jgi:anaerobic ribonucleoside-triphosphate reductase